MTKLFAAVLLVLLTGCSSDEGASRGTPDAGAGGASTGGTTSTGGAAGTTDAGTGGTGHLPDGSTVCAAVDTSRNSANCGACGHACGPSTLVSGDLSPGPFAVDATNVYWVTGDSSGTVMKMPLAGGTPTTLATGQTNPGVVAVDATSVYWTSGGAVRRIPLSGGTPTTLVTSGATAIAIDATSVYWTASDGAVMKIPLSGGTPTTLDAGRDASGGGLGGIAVDATSVYWTASDGAVIKMPLGGGTATMLAAGEGYPGAITVDATSVYWLNQGTSGGPYGERIIQPGEVMKVPVRGGTPTTLATGQENPGAIAVDATGVYWMADRGAVMKVPLGGGAPTMLAPSGGAGAIVADATNVYWKKHTRGSGDSVMRLGPCEGGACTCPGVDTNSDAANCGACGHVCGPITLASDQRYPRAIAVDATSVYWTGGGSTAPDGIVMKVSRGGGAPTTLATADHPGSIAVDATNVYWASDVEPCSSGSCGTVVKMPIGGGTPTMLVSGQRNLFDIAIDAKNVYWSASNTPTGVAQLMRVPLVGGGAPAPLAPGWVNRIAVDSTSVYWTEYSAPGTVMKVPVDGGTPITLATGPVNGGGIAVDTTSVYWTAGAAMMKVPLGGGTPSTLVSSGVEGDSVSVDAASVYYIGDRAILKVPRGGGSPITVATGDPAAIAVDATGVYWVNAGTYTSHRYNNDGAVMEAPVGGLCQAGVCK